MPTSVCSSCGAALDKPVPRGLCASCAAKQGDALEPPRRRGSTTGSLKIPTLDEPAGKSPKAPEGDATPRRGSTSGRFQSLSGDRAVEPPRRESPSGRFQGLGSDGEARRESPSGRFQGLGSDGEARRGSTTGRFQSLSGDRAVEPPRRESPSGRFQALGGGDAAALEPKRGASGRFRPVGPEAAPSSSGAGEGAALEPGRRRDTKRISGSFPVASPLEPTAPAPPPQPEEGFALDAATALGKKDEPAAPAPAQAEPEGPHSDFLEDVSHLAGGKAPEPAPAAPPEPDGPHSDFVEDVTHLGGKGPPKTGAAKADAGKTDAPRTDAPRTDAARPDSSPALKAARGAPSRPSGRLDRKSSGAVPTRAELDAVLGDAIEIKQGLVIGGCEIVASIGRGRSGFVYKGNLKTGEVVAVKVLDERLAGRAGYAEQFLQDMRALARIDHPSVAKVHSSGVDQEGRHFIITEYLEGGSVEALWASRKKKLGVEDAIRIAREAAQGLAAIHRANLTHRDVRPRNLLLTKEGRVKVVDTALAVPPESEVYLTTDVQVTPQYMSPEQADGRRTDERGDQYALGITLFQLVCGRVPFDGKTALAVIIAQARERPPRPSSVEPAVPPWLEATILKMLAKRPTDRFASMEDAIKVLEAGPSASDRIASLAEAPEDASPIALDEIVALEAGVPPRPVNQPSWWGVMVLVAALSVGAIVFVDEPIRWLLDAKPPAREGTGGALKRILEDVELRVASGRPADLAAARALLADKVADLGNVEGAESARGRLATLDRALGDARKKKLAELEASADAAAGAGRFAEALDLANAADGEVVALGLETAVSDLRAKLAARLADERGEVYVPGGSYRAGPDAVPTKVAPFYMGRTEVTNADYERAVTTKGITPPPAWGGHKAPAGTADLPVTGVAWSDARAYAAAFGKRLPTPREWEKAARGADDARAYPWGDVFDPGRANLLEGGSGALEPVTQRPRDVSPYGVLGLAGNALEWGDRNGSPVVLGGGFRSSAGTARVWSSFAAKGDRHPGVGFRCVRDVEPPPGR